ncbi:MAG TPA: neuraminidase (sialidase)-like protein, partial [Candidatus Hydrogenedentes bacterium]|nr:neuraminidase (sialidase)-like protein [Candidatus Hydrogenedentota bacterium]
VTLMPIRNPGSSVECIALRNGHWMLVCNDTVEGRHILSVYLSEDEGASWPWRRRLESFEPGDGSGSYPSMLQSVEGTLHCTYSYRDQHMEGSSIKHVRFNEAWVRAGDG